MEQKLVRVPFEVEMAKKIQNGEIEGRIVTRAGGNARILCFDKKDDTFPIVALIEEGNIENAEGYMSNGRWSSDEDEEGGLDLMLEIPEYFTFKDGDILRAYDNIVIVKNPRIDDEGCFNFNQYAGCNFNTGKLTDVDCYIDQKCVRYANDKEREIIKKAMQESGNPKYDDILKNIFGIEEKKGYEFKPFDKVLVRDDKKHSWNADFFSHISREVVGYVCVGGLWNYCIPYNEQTAHLLGTTDNWEV